MEKYTVYALVDRTKKSNLADQTNDHNPRKYETKSKINNKVEQSNIYRKLVPNKFMSIKYSYLISKQSPSVRCRFLLRYCQNITMIIHSIN